MKPTLAMETNRSMPVTQVIPELNYPDVAIAASWLARAFGFETRLQIGGHRIQMVYGSGAIIVREGPVSAEAAGTHAVMVRVANVDAHYARAMTAGAKLSGPPQTFPFGERQYGARDLAGHAWVFSQTVEDVDPAAWGGQVPGS